MTRGYKLNTVEQAHNEVALIYKLDAEAEVFKVLHATENIDSKLLEQLQNTIVQFDNAIQQLNNAITDKLSEINHGLF